MSTVQTKADFRDIDTLNQRMHQKVDQDKLQNMIAELRQEMLNNLTTIKKENLQKTKKKDEDMKVVRGEIE